MLSVRPKITKLNFHLFARSVHPELFEICARRSFQRDRYELGVNITTDGHVITFQHDGLILTETSAGAHHPLPENSLLLSHPIGVVRQNVLNVRGLVNYQTEVQLETVPPKTFAVIADQLDSRVECEGLVHRFESNGRVAFGALSYINVQSFRSRVTVRSFHTFPDTCAVLKTESRFSLNAESDK